MLPQLNLKTKQKTNRQKTTKQDLNRYLMWFSSFKALSVQYLIFSNDTIQ